MTDLTFCYLHMTEHDLKIIDTIDGLEYMKGELSDDELDIPSHMIPPNPDDSDILPSQVHPSYPYGNPTNIKHPAARPRPPYDPSSRALFEDMGYAGAGVNGTLRWKDLALNELLPIDHEKEEAKRAVYARKMASGGASNTQNPLPSQIEQPAADQTTDAGDDDGNDGGGNEETSEEGLGESLEEEV